MNIELVSSDPSLTHLRLTGRISQRSLADENDSIETVVGNDVFALPLMLDLRGTEYLDSSGVGWLLTVHKRCREAGGRMVLYGVPPIVLQVLRVLRLHMVLDLADNEAQARRMLEAAGEA